MTIINNFGKVEQKQTASECNLTQFQFQELEPRGFICQGEESLDMPWRESG